MCLVPVANAKLQIPSVNTAAQSLDYQPVSKVITNEGISEITLHVLN